MMWNDNDIKLVERFIEIKNKGFYASGKEVTDIYNRVLQKKVQVTTCSSCIRQRICELEKALNQFKALSQQKEEEQPKVTEEPKKDKSVTKKKPGRPKKSK